MDVLAFDDNSQVFEFVVKKGYGVKGLVDTGLTSLPPLYIHPPHDRFDRKKIIDVAPYLGPPIDLSGLEGENEGAVIDTLCGAAEKRGFFQVVNHGVSLELMERAKRASHTFFNLPYEKKAMYLKGTTPCPNVYYSTSFSPDVEESLEWRDYLSMMYISDEEALQFWPQDCRDAVLDYLKAADKMINGIMSALLRGLGVEINESTVRSYTESRALNLNFYPPCPNPELTVGVGRHSDLAPFTILLQDEIGGLFVKVEDKGWIEVPPVDGALVVNVGDTFEIISNGRYKSAEHQVIASSSKARVSVPIFVSPRPHTMIGPMPGLSEKDGKTLYRQLPYEECMANYFGGAHKEKKTVEFARV